jgi:hypothetical protein
MRLPRVQLKVRWLLVTVAVIGLDFGLVRGAAQIDESEPCTSSLTLPALMFVPPLSLLSVAAVNAGLGLARCGRASSFSTGYLLLGGLASLAVSLDLASGQNLLGLGSDVVCRMLGELEGQSCLDGWSGTMILVVVCDLPQLALALIGGGLASRYGLTIISRGQLVPLRPHRTVSGEV